MKAGQLVSQTGELVLRYNYIPKTIVSYASVVMDENCNGVMIINIGAS